MRSARPLTLILLLCLVGGAGTSSYTLKRGDTLGRIATKFHVPLGALTAANDIADANKVKAGQKLTVPDPKAAQVAAATPIATTVAAAAPTDGSKLYAVEAGD